jgi:hypothetical protein
LPRVSVLLPVRDAEATLDAALESLRSQTLADHEVVAVDDGSTDGSAARLDAAAAADPRLRVVHAPPLGLVAALNRALAEARAPVVARMDADDVSLPRRLELQALRLETDAGVDVLGTRVELVSDPKLRNAGMRAYVEWQNGLVDHAAIVADLYVEAPLVHPSVALRRETLVALGGYRDTGGPEDYDLWLRAHAAGLRFAKLEETLLRWRDRPGRLTRRDPRYAPARFLEARCAALVAGPLRDGKSIVIWGAGKAGKALVRALSDAGRPAAAFVEVDPAKIGQRIHGLRVVAVPEAVSFEGAWHVAAVGQPGARERIRGEARRLGIPAERLVAVA